ncbi:MAG: UDP-glucose 4-epimerase [Candidatus Heimdallarchaeota archaeon LC_3]|nr:MAG: UDP-glucose 4-epimerase [Candidatus Heimdallarchaeota archaeon LC_3]
MTGIFITGSQGFIGSYLCNEFLDKGYTVFGIDNYSKYGKIVRRHDSHKNFYFKSIDLAKSTVKNIENEIKDWKFEYIIAGAAMIGGISYFHKFAYDLLAANERILANTFDLAIQKFKENNLKRILVLSSSMVFERTTVFPTPELEIDKCPPPLSTYGFQKLASEYFCKGVWEQHNVPYTIIRPFNAIGIGEEKAISDNESYTSGDLQLLLSHVVPDLIVKCLKAQDPLHILGKGNQVRHYTNGKDIARGVRLALESDKAVNQDFNISHQQPHTVLQVAKVIWNKINPNKPFKVVNDPPFEYDVQTRSPDVTKAKNILGFEAEISLEESLDQIIPYYKDKVEKNLL